MHYEKINPITRQEAEVVFNQGNSEEIAAALLSVTFHDEDWLWVQSSCLKFLASPDENLRAVAATCLGHLARIHGMVDVAMVVPALQAHLSDSAIAGRVSDALDDIEMFVKGSSSPHTYE
jgi:hypothetical protein